MLPPQLAKAQQEAREAALQYGLKFFEVEFHLLREDIINTLAAGGGFPRRYPHWRFGMEYAKWKKRHKYGAAKIYEMVINTNPCHAYLVSTNTYADHKTVMAHVYAHSDFFRNNMYFAHTDPNMLDTMANHGARIRRHIDKHGEDAVERFLDACLSFENLIDPHRFAIVRSREPPRDPREKQSPKPVDVTRLPTDRGYMDTFINPKGKLEDERKRLEKEQCERLERFPADPTPDVLEFLQRYAPLEDWQRDILGIIREEAYYFLPQRQTKIINEGWAAYWHSRCMTEKTGTVEDLIDYADHHSGTLFMPRRGFNPYKYGIEIFRDIEDRWDKGRFGPDWARCENRYARKNWDHGTLKGQEKIFEVRRLYDDYHFIDEFLTPELCETLKLFNYKRDKNTGEVKIEDRDHEKIRKRLLDQLANCGEPKIMLVDANHNNRGQLLLRHEWTGPPLKRPEADDTVINLAKVWGKPVCLETMTKKTGLRLISDGTKIREEKRSLSHDEEAQQSELF